MVSRCVSCTYLLVSAMNSMISFELDWYIIHNLKSCQLPSFSEFDCFDFERIPISNSINMFWSLKIPYHLQWFKAKWKLSPPSLRSYRWRKIMASLCVWIASNSRMHGWMNFSQNSSDTTLEILEIPCIYETKFCYYGLNWGLARTWEVSTWFWYQWEVSNI